MLRRKAGWLAALLVGVSPVSPTWAQAIDANKPLLCALVDIHSCAPSESGVNCQKQTPESANVPRFLRIDVADKNIVGTRSDGEQKNTKIATVQRVQDHLLLQGIDDGPLSWSIAIIESTGAMSLTVAKPDVGFVVFGACTEP